jgi:hypothetical protein
MKTQKQIKLIFIKEAKRNCYVQQKGVLDVDVFVLKLLLLLLLLLEI